MRRRIPALILFLVLALPALLLAGTLEELPAFTPEDRVLVLAPHPDDETIGVGGAIMRALKAGARVKVACFTNGDHNEIAFILYEKRLTLRKSVFLHMGDVRRKETLSALAKIGVSGDDVDFFGYPDFGTLSIMLKYWGDVKPYKSILTRIDSVDYKDVLSPDAPYKGESILNDMRSLLNGFRPTKVFVSHPADTNMDHQALYLFLRVALWDLEETVRPQVFPYLIHVSGWPLPRGARPEMALAPPPGNLFDVAWRRLDLTADEVRMKREMIASYKSQLACVPSYLYTFVRRNELFGDCPEVHLRESGSDLYRWHSITSPGAVGSGRERDADQVARLAFAQKDDALLVKIFLKNAMNKNLGVRLLLLGYSSVTAFEHMPKISVTIGLRGMQIRNGQRTVKIQGALYTVKGRGIVVKVPLSGLGYPERILCKTWARFSKEFPFRAPAWRVINVSKEWKEP